MERGGTLRTVGLGAGGHARVVIEILRFDPSVELVGLLDPNPELQGGEMMGLPVLGDDTLLPRLAVDGIGNFFVGVGGIGDNGPRERLFRLAINHGLKPVKSIHPAAVVSPSAEIGEGITIMAGAVINPGVLIGGNVIVNTGAVVDHDCRIQSHVHIAVGAVLASTVHVERGAHVGAGATVLQGLRIGEGAVVGAGAVVTRDVPPRSTVVGCPARVIGPERRKGR